MKKQIIPLFAVAALLTPSRITAQESLDSLQNDSRIVNEEVVSIDSISKAEVTGVSIINPQLVRDSTQMEVSMQLNFSALKLKSNRAVILSPIISNGERSEKLPSIGIYGRNRWYQSYRDGRRPFSNSQEKSYRYSERPTTENYSFSLQYEDWMDGAELFINRYEYGCCNDSSSVSSTALAQYLEPEIIIYEPTLIYIRPVADAVKTRELSGKAYIDFPVNRTELNPDFRNNQFELNKIIATIDSVRGDEDITVTAIQIIGSASPEGTYSNNVRLAKGRTEALKDYVIGLYNFDPSLISTDYVPEDWAGLREYVKSSNLTHKNEILAIIDDSTLDLDIKDKRIKTNYGNEYQFLLKEVYPTLRRSDYRIEYAIRSFSNLEEIKQLLNTNPQKLSLSEMFLLAQSLEPGTDEYDEVFEVAVRMYPSDETANLNAANSALARKDLNKAARYLDKAGNSAEAVYARGVLSALNGDKETAIQLIRQAGEMGLEDTDNIIDYIDKSELPKK